MLSAGSLTRLASILNGRLVEDVVTDSEDESAPSSPLEVEYPKDTNAGSERVPRAEVSPIGSSGNANGGTDVHAYCSRDRSGGNHDGDGMEPGGPDSTIVGTKFWSSHTTKIDGFRSGHARCRPQRGLNAMIDELLNSQVS